MIEVEKEEQTLTVKDYDGNIISTTPIGYIGRALSLKQFAYIFSDFINCHWGDFKHGEKVGVEYHNEHRTLQASAFRFMLGFICGLGKQDERYTDPRNEIAVRTSNKIRQMVESGELEKGYMI